MIIIGFIVIVLLMVAEDRQIKRDIDAAAKAEWTKKDAEDYIREPW